MDPIKVGQVIATHRRKLSMTQAQLAEILNVSNKSVSRWENGVTMPDISLLIPLAETLHISLNVLLGEEEDTEDKEVLVKETIRMSAAEVVRQKSLNFRLIMNLISIGLLVFTFTPWCYARGEVENLRLIDPSGFYFIIALLALYGVLVNLCDQRKSVISMTSYLILVLIIGTLLRELLQIISLAQTVESYRITPMPAITILYALAMIVAHHNLFNSERISMNRLSVNNRNGHLILYALAVIMVALVGFVPTFNNGVASRFVMESFVEREPYWYGNYQNTDLYHGVILTWGYVSLLLCPLLCLWARFRSKVIYVLTNMAIIHILASVLNYSFRFRISFSELLSPIYVILVLLPILMLAMLYLMYYDETFGKRKAERLSRMDFTLQLVYLVLSVWLFSALFSVIPFINISYSSKGEWLLMSFMTVLAMITAFEVFTDGQLQYLLLGREKEEEPQN